MLGLQRFTCNFGTQLFRRAALNSSSVRNTARANTALASNRGEPSASTEASTEATEVSSKKPKNSLVTAAFEALNADDPNATVTGEKKKPAKDSLDERILKANTINGLLTVTEVNGPISRKHALKIVSILAEWSSINRVKVSEFENDQRFLRICRVLGRTVKNNGNGKNNESERISGFRTDDLNTVLGVAGDDEAAKLIASISVAQMVKVMSTLAQRKRRSTPLLRSLAFNISSSTEPLDLKQCADILYAMATLNFKDSVLAAKICADIQSGLPKNNEKSAVVGSILTSLGILKYRDLDILESLTEWTLNNSDICRPQDLSALFLTSAFVNFRSAKIEDVANKLVNIVLREDFTKHLDWLNHVWALTLLRVASNEHIATVLSETFLQQISDDNQGLSPTAKMKLLNLNSYAKLMAENYKGPLLSPKSGVFEVTIGHSKSKQVLLNGMLDALKSLLPASNHVQVLIDSKMGFLIDALCLFDAKRNPLPLDKEHANSIKLALMVVDYHDICHGTHRSVCGITNLSFDLLEKSGYKVVPVPYNEFNTSDKLLKRVQYLEGKFKNVISSQN